MRNGLRCRSGTPRLACLVRVAEVYYGGSSSNKKRISPSIDAGYVTQSATYSGRSLYRHIDEEATQEAGYEVMADTNNSSTDFYERDKPSLHE